jgi:hypothetical protein
MPAAPNTPAPPHKPDWRTLRIGQQPQSIGSSIRMTRSRRKGAESPRAPAPPRRTTSHCFLVTTAETHALASTNPIPSARYAVPSSGRATSDLHRTSGHPEPYGQGRAAHSHGSAVMETAGVVHSPTRVRRQLRHDSNSVVNGCETLIRAVKTPRCRTRGRRSPEQCHGARFRPFRTDVSASTTAAASSRDRRPIRGPPWVRPLQEVPLDVGGIALTCRFAGCPASGEHEACPSPGEVACRARLGQA